MSRKHFVVEILIVVFGVLIAFWMNKLGEQRKLDQLRTNVVHSIFEEIKSNSVKLNRHVLEKDTILYLLANTLEKYETGSSKEGLELNADFAKPLLSTTGYEIAKTTGVISEIEYELAFKIIEYYNQLEELSKLEDKLLENIFLKGIDGIEGLKRLHFQVGELNKNYKDILMEQDSLIRQLAE